MPRPLALTLSILFHPMLVPTWGLLLLMSVNPFAFGLSGFSDPKAWPLVMMVFFSTFLIPAVGIGLMKPLGFIDSFSMETQKERHGPYIVTAIFYLWLLKNVMAKGLLPPLCTSMLLGATLGLLLAFFANIFFKISAHAIGMGGLAMVVVLTLRRWGSGSLAVGSLAFSLEAVLWAAVVVAGLVGAARLSLRAHEAGEVYSGYLVGAAAMGVAVMIG